MADINTIISKEAIAGIKTADDNINSLDTNIKNFITTLVAANKELKSQGITFKDLSAAQQQQKTNTQTLTAEQTKLNAIEKQNAVTTKAIIAEKVKLAEKTKTLKDEVIKERAAMNEEANSIAALNRRNKELGKQRDLVSTKTKQGQLEIKKINAELDKNNAVIKKNKDALSQQKIGIGGYSAGIQQAAGSMGLFGGAATKMTSALGFVSIGFKTLKGAIMSTGIGALVIGFIALVQYFKSTEEGAAKLQKIIAPFKILFGNITDALAVLGEKLVWVFDNPKQAISDLWTAIKQNFVNRIHALQKFIGAFGDILQGIWELDGDKIKAAATEAGKQYIDMMTGIENTTEKSTDIIGDFIKKIAKETREETKQQLELIDAQLALDKRRRAFLVEEAEIMTEISGLRLLANDETKDLHDRQNAINEALRLNTVLADKRMANEVEQLRIMKLEASFSKSNAETLNAIAEKEREIILLKKTQDDSARMMVMKQATINNKLQTQLDLENEIAEAKAAEFTFKEDEEIMDFSATPEFIAAGERSAAIIKLAQDTSKEKLAIEEIEVQEIRSLINAKVLDAEAGEALITEITKRNAEERKEAIISSLEAANEALNLGVDIYQGTLDRKSQALQEQRESELQKAGENKELQDQINKKFDAKEAAIKTKKAKADKTAALITAAINTAVAITSVSPVVPLMVLAGLFGALQIAAIAAQPIPKFFKGTESAPGGLISVGEKGRELIETKTGSLLMANKPTITSGLQGAKIYTNEQTERIINHRKTGYDSPDLRGVIESNNRIEKAIRNQKHISIDRHNRTITERKDNYAKTYMNAKITGF
jgi:hypothetical protein